MSNFEQRWQALREARGAGRTPADAHFVYAVLTTGIFCRLGCKSRLPLRDNVRFFESTVAARHAGYRACKRCRPERTRPREHDLVERACRLLERSETPPALEALARAAGLGSSRFHKLFKATLGVTPKQYATAYRRNELQRALEAGQPVTQAIVEARYSSPSRVYEHQNDLLGMSPGAYARGGDGELVRFGVEPCSLGQVLVAVSARGICAVELGANQKALVQSLRRRFPGARRTPLDGALRRFLKAVVREIDQSPGDLDAPSLPLDIRGTAFQQRVWTALAAVPRGQTTTYSDLAASLGVPRATRAVANACAANALAVLVPCHRVRRKDGGLGGYLWGVGRKEALLARERGSTRRPSRSVAKTRR